MVGQLQGAARLMALLLYGAGLRLLEGLQLRVKDVDFGARQLTIRSGKGNRDRVAILPDVVRTDLELHVRDMHDAHGRDPRRGQGRGRDSERARGQVPECRERMGLAMGVSRDADV